MIKKIFQLIISFLIFLSFILAIQMLQSIDETNSKIDDLNNQISEIQKEQEDIEIRINEQEEITLAEQTAYKRDVPLSDEIQKFTYDICTEYEVDYDLVLSIMREESQYTAGLISDTGDYGIMQINIINHDWLAEIGLYDMLDERQNITAGVIILSQLQKEFNNPESVLMAYNLGAGKAKEYLLQGKTIEYTQKILGGN